MDTMNIIFTFGGLVIGSIVTFLVSRHFFKKGIKEKSFTPFVQFTSTLFSELDPELQKNLKVNYKNQEIENITQTQFVIANTGDVPIRDIIKPLQLTLPKENKILGVNIVYTKPKEREVEYKIIETDNSNTIEFIIPLLNAKEYFVVKIIIQDVLKNPEKDKNKKYLFSITADDLPPKLTIKNFPSSHYEKGEEKEIGAGSILIWIGVIPLIFYISIMGIMSFFKHNYPQLHLFSFKEFFASGNFGFYNVCAIILFLLSVIMFLIALLGFGGAAEIRSSKKNAKFKVPRTFRKNNVIKFEETK